MTKAIRVLCTLAFMLACACYGQVSQQLNNVGLGGTVQLPYVTVAPSGSCTIINQVQTLINGSGALVNYGCSPSSGTSCPCTWVQVTGSGGGVTSVAMTLPSWLSVSGSPITTSGTLAVSAATGQTQNRVLASPNGSSGALSVRALVAADLPSSITSNTSGNAATANALAATPTTCSTGQAPTGVLANGNATGCASISGTSAGRFTISTTGTSATLSCTSCGVQKGDSSLLMTGVSASFTVPGTNANSYTALFCLDGNTIDLAYNGSATITTSSGLTLIASAVACPTDTITLATVSVVNTAVTASTLVDPGYYQPKTYSFPQGTVTGTYAKSVSFNLTKKLGGPFSPGTGGSGVLVDSDLTWTGFFINDSTAKTLTEASCYSDTGSQNVTVKIGTLTAFTITCVTRGSYIADGLGTHGHIDLAHMTNSVIEANTGTNIDLNQSGTANGSTHWTQLVVWGQ